MIFKPFILFLFINLSLCAFNPKEDKIKAWIELEGELKSLAIRAKIENSSHKNIILSYELETLTHSRIKNYKTLQKGKLLVLKESIISLSESRMNVKTTDELCIRIKVYHEDEIVAVDSVLYHTSR